MKAEEAARICTSLEFVFVTGKGGVGKSTVSALLALWGGEAGKRTLVAYPATSPPPFALWGQHISTLPTKVAPGVDAVLIDPLGSMQEYAADVLSSRKLASVLFHSKVAKGLLTGIPGPSDWAILGRAWSLTRASTFHLRQGERPYDLVILDGPSSGDGANMLKVPQVIVQLAPAARLRSDAESCLSMLRDEKRSAVVLVTLGEELALSETEESLLVVRQELGMPVGPVFLNQCLSLSFSDEDRQTLQDLDPQDLTDSESTDPEARTRAQVLKVAARRASREALHFKHVSRVSGWGGPFVQVPKSTEENHDIPLVKKLKLALAERV